MERGTTFLLKATVFVIGILTLASCIAGLPRIAREVADYYPGYIWIPIFAGAYAAAIPFYVALYQALKLLSLIDRNDAFSDLAVTALKNIKICAVTISLIYVACMPFLYLLADRDDAPGIIVIGLVIIFASTVIALFAAVLQRLLRNAIDIKSENDLTV